MEKDTVSMHFVDDAVARLAPALRRRVMAAAGIAERRFADETFLVMVHGLMCWLGGKRIAITEAGFAHSGPAHACEYTAGAGRPR